MEAWDASVEALGGASGMKVDEALLARCRPYLEAQYWGAVGARSAEMSEVRCGSFFFFFVFVSKLSPIVGVALSSCPRRCIKRVHSLFFLPNHRRTRG